MDVFLLPFLILSVIGVKIAHKDNIFNENNLDRDHTDALRGFLCILIVLDHCSLLTGSGYSVILLKRVGPYIVAMFYALSAYGLLASYKKKGSASKDIGKRGCLVLSSHILFSILRRSSFSLCLKRICLSKQYCCHLLTVIRWSGIHGSSLRSLYSTPFFTRQRCWQERTSLCSLL